MTNVINFITSNIDLVIAILMAVSALVGAIISKNKQQVFTKIYSLVIKAELLEGATGVDKFSYVFDNAYNALPFYIKAFVSEDNVKRAIQFSLDKLKDFANEQITTSTVKISSVVEPVVTDVADPSVEETPVISTNDVCETTPVVTNPIIDTDAPVQEVAPTEGVTTVKVDVPVAPVATPIDTVAKIDNLVNALTDVKAQLVSGASVTTVDVTTPTTPVA